MIGFDDIQGSFFLNTIDFYQTDGLVNQSGIGHGSKPRFRFDIKYQYQINGELYESSRVGFGFKGSDKKESVDLILNRYPVGQSVTVYYDKSNPKFSILEPERNSRFVFILLLALYFMGIGLAIYAFVKTRYNKFFS